MACSSWNPIQYDLFCEERRQPFSDLLALLRPIPGGRVVDLGCGTGELTAILHRELCAHETLGIDRSSTMLAGHNLQPVPGLSFVCMDIRDFVPEQPFHVVFSNAALQWVDDHPQLFAHLRRWLAPGGQLAVQIPANHGHVSHRLAHEIAGEQPFAAALGGYTRRVSVLPPAVYSELLHQLGFTAQHVRLQVYGHQFPMRESVLEWVKGTLLVDYQERLPPDLFAAFREVYRERLLAELPDEHPFFYPFARVLLWAALPVA